MGTDDKPGRPRLSIILTAYNVAPYIEQCYRSIAAQTVSDFELICVDDASNDGTADLLREFAARDPRIKLIVLAENTPGGAGPPSNIGLDAATGDYIGFVDADDWCEPDMFELLLLQADRTGADVVIADYLEFDEQAKTYKKPGDTKRWRHLLAFEDTGSVEFKKVCLQMISVPWRKLYRRDFIEKHQIRFPEGDFFYEDNPFHWFVTIQAEKTALLHKVVCYHRTKRPGQTMSANADQFLTMFKHHETIMAFLISKNAINFYENSLIEWTLIQSDWIYNRLYVQNISSKKFNNILIKTKYHKSKNVNKIIKKNTRKKSTHILAYYFINDRLGDFLSEKNQRKITVYSKLKNIAARFYLALNKRNRYEENHNDTCI